MKSKIIAIFLGILFSTMAIAMEVEIENKDSLIAPNSHPIDKLTYKILQTNQSCQEGMLKEYLNIEEELRIDNLNKLKSDPEMRIDIGPQAFIRIMARFKRKFKSDLFSFNSLGISVIAWNNKGKTSLAPGLLVNAPIDSNQQILFLETQYCSATSCSRFESPTHNEKHKISIYINPSKPCN